MSGGGGGGIIIIHRLLEEPAVINNPVDCRVLQAIADRSPVRLSRQDAITVLFLLWKYLRGS